MRLFRNSLFFLVTLSFIWACQPADRVYIEHRGLSTELEWRREDSRSFEVPIENTDQTYQVRLGFRYATGFPYQFAKVKVVEETPSGKKSEAHYDLKIRELSGEYIGEPGLDIWDSEHLVEPSKVYSEPGTYKYTISHVMEKDVMPMAMEVSFILDKVSSEE